MKSSTKQIQMNIENILMLAAGFYLEGFSKSINHLAWPGKMPGAGCWVLGASYSLQENAFSGFSRRSRRKHKAWGGAAQPSATPGLQPSIRQAREAGGRELSIARFAG